MDEKKITVLFVSTFILVLLAIAFLTSISEQTSLSTEKTKVADESYNLTGEGCYAGGQVNESDSDCNLTVTNAPTGWKAVDCALTSVVVTNTTGTTLTSGTDYNVYASTGVVQMLNTTDTDVESLGNNVLIDYSYCGDSYVNSSWGRSILGVNVGLFAVAILIAVVLLVYVLFDKKKE